MFPVHHGVDSMIPNISIHRTDTCCSPDSRERRVQIATTSAILYFKKQPPMLESREPGIGNNRPFHKALSTTLQRRSKCQNHSTPGDNTDYQCFSHMATQGLYGWKRLRLSMPRSPKVDTSPKVDRCAKNPKPLYQDPQKHPKK
eukprot:5485716-Amphidinium_carterae.1